MIRYYKIYKYPFLNFHLQLRIIKKIILCLLTQGTYFQANKVFAVELDPPESRGAQEKRVQPDNTVRPVPRVSSNIIKPVSPLPGECI